MRDVCSIGTLLAILGFPPIIGTYVSFFVAALRAASGSPIQAVTTDATRAGFWTGVATSPIGFVGVELALRRSRTCPIVLLGRP